MENTTELENGLLDPKDYDKKSQKLVEDFNQRLRDIYNEVYESRFVIDSLMEEFRTIWIVDCESLKMKLYKLDGVITSRNVKNTDYSADYVQTMNFYIQNFVTENDRLSLYEKTNIDNIMKKINRKGLYAITYLYQDEEESKYDQIVFSKASPSKLILGFRSIDESIRHQLEENVREAQFNQFKEDLVSMKLIHETMDSGSWELEFDSDNQICSCVFSDQFRQRVGYSDEEDFPNDISSLEKILSPEDLSSISNSFMEAVNDKTGNTIFDVEKKVITKYGNVHWFHAAGRLSRDKNGNPLRFVGMFSDIQSKKESEEIVSGLSKNYLSIFKVNLDSATFKVVKHSQFTTEVFNKNQSYSYKDFIQTYTQQIVFEDDKELFFEAMDLNRVSEILSKKDEYIYGYRVFTNEEIHFCQFKFIRLGVSTNNEVIVGFKNIDESIKVKNDLESYIKLSEMDQMTKLLNRTSGENKVIQSLKNDEKGMLLMLDIDKFKFINDNFGHTVGDKVIESVAQCINKAFRDKDIKFRLGGDEFMIYALNVSTVEQGNLALERFIRNVESISIEELDDHKVSVSIGATLVEKANEKNFKDLYKSIDKCLYSSKKIEGNAVTFTE